MTARGSAYLARGGQVNPVNLAAGLPMGLFADETYSATDLQLDSGDRVVFVTDGMLERNAVPSTSLLRSARRGRCTRATPPQARGSGPGDRTRARRDVTLLSRSWWELAAVTVVARDAPTSGLARGRGGHRLPGLWLPHLGPR